MQLTQALEDQELRRLLQGDENDLELAFTQVDAQLRRRFVRGARARLPGVPAEDLADAWQETLKTLLQAVRSGSFQATRELIPWLWTIFLRKALDGLRQRKRLVTLASRARGRAMGIEAGNAHAGLDDEDRRARLARVQEAVDTLPPPPADGPAGLSGSLPGDSEPPRAASAGVGGFRAGRNGKLRPPGSGRGPRPTLEGSPDGAHLGGCGWGCR